MLILIPPNVKRRLGKVEYILTTRGESLSYGPLCLSFPNTESSYYKIIRSRGPPDDMEMVMIGTTVKMTLSSLKVHNELNR